MGMEHHVQCVAVTVTGLEYLCYAQVVAAYLYFILNVSILGLSFLRNYIPIVQNYYLEVDRTDVDLGAFVIFKVSFIENDVP